MTITAASETDVFDWPEHGITMTRQQAERLGEEGHPLPAGEPHTYTAEMARLAGLKASPYSALVQRLAFYARGRDKPARECDMEPAE